MELFKKAGSMIFIAILFLTIFAVPVCAQESETIDNQQIMEEQLEISGADELYDQIPDSANEILENNGIDGINPDSLIGLSVGDFFQTLWDMVKSEIHLPLRIFITMIAVVMLCSLFRAFQATIAEKSYTNAFTVVSVLTVCAVMMSPIVDCITRASEAIRECSNFIVSFIPVFSGIVAASGKPITAAGYTSALVGTIQIIAQIAANFLVPLLGMYLAFCMVGSINDNINISGITATVRNVVIWTLGFLLTVFVGLLTLKGLVAGSADTVATKTTKFLLGSFVPVVGGALSEAYNSVQGCMGVIRSTVGSLGIIVCFLTFVPILLTILLLMGALHLSAGISELMSVEKVGSILKAGVSALSLIFGIILMFALLLIISVTILLMISTG